MFGLNDIFGDVTSVVEGWGEDIYTTFFGTPEKTSNPENTNNNNAFVDQYGNHITSGQYVTSANGTTTTDNTLLWIAGGVGVVALLGIVVFAMKK